MPVPTLGTSDFRRICDLIYQEAGIRLGDQKMSLVQNRLHRRLQANACRDFHSYLDLVSTDGSTELRFFVEALTTNETFFFRHKDHWDHFITSILAQWPAERALRVWSAAASTGEEAYSAAIACLEHHRGQGAVVIEASDINAAVLEKARRGIYGAYALQKVTSYARARWFTPVGENWRVADAPRSLVDFRTGNLLEPSRGPAVDVVFLRNVLIYFDEPSKLAALTQVSARLRPGGWLFLGGSEALPPGIAGFTAIRPQIYRKAA
jgi:chemotaxis protein methyltransferase CheR